MPAGATVQAAKGATHGSGVVGAMLVDSKCSCGYTAPATIHTIIHSTILTYYYPRLVYASVEYVGVVTVQPRLAAVERAVGRGRVGVEKVQGVVRVEGEHHTRPPGRVRVRVRVRVRGSIFLCLFF